VLSAAGVGWPDGGTVLIPGVTGLGWPGERLGSSLQPPEQVSRGTSVNDQEDLSLPGSDRVRNALAAAVSRGTPIKGERMSPQPTGPDAPVVVPDAPMTSGDTPIARLAEAAVGARGAAKRENWPRPKRCRIMTIANQKGGVGKTTTAVNLAASLSQHGNRVLVVDLDPQGNASTALDVDHHVGVDSVYNALVEERPLSDIVVEVGGMPGLYCAPATIDLAGAEIELVPLVARESRLTRSIDQLDMTNFDYVLIDCPPSLGLLTVNALVAAEEVLIPIQCEYYALEGLEQLLRTLELVRGHLNAKLRISTILLTMYDGRTRLATQVAEDVRSHFGDVVLQTIIPRSVRVSEAPSYGQSVITYDPASSGAVAYAEAARELAYRATDKPFRWPEGAAHPRSLPLLVSGVTAAEVFSRCRLHVAVRSRDPGCHICFTA
jgi:chromosome partitioning protein